ncbi:MAG: response regulator [Acidimicrobiia bacterium]|nr:response regulator [Acidimicrobiia bacterium]
MNGRILIAEDDEKQAELIRLYLEREGYSVVVAYDGRDALDQIRARQPDLVVLDWMMPAMDGLDVTRVLRQESDVPIIMLTARSTEEDLLLGLELGADDYITKPFSPRELTARVRTVMRRRAPQPAEDALRIGELEVDPVRHQVRMHGAEVEVTPKEFAILEALARHPGRAFTRTQLLQQAFGFDYDGLERTVDVHVLNLRKKLEPDPTSPTYLSTVYGVGYKMAEHGDG